MKKRTDDLFKIKKKQLKLINDEQYGSCGIIIRKQNYEKINKLSRSADNLALIVNNIKTNQVNVSKIKQQQAKREGKREILYTLALKSFQHPSEKKPYRRDGKNKILIYTRTRDKILKV